MITATEALALTLNVTKEDVLRRKLAVLISEMNVSIKYAAEKGESVLENNMQMIDPDVLPLLDKYLKEQGYTTSVIGNNRYIISWGNS